MVVREGAELIFCLVVELLLLGLGLRGEIVVVVLFCVIELPACRGRVGGCQRGGGGTFRAKKRQIAGSDTLLGCYCKCFWYLCLYLFLFY